MMWEWSLAVLPAWLALSGWWAGQYRALAAHRAKWAVYIYVPVSLSVLVLNSNLDVLPQSWLTLSPLRLMMSCLLIFMCWVLVQFSQQYMEGERNVEHYYRRLLLTIAAVQLVVVSNHVGLFWMGWVAISLSLHRLLMFYPDRPRAVLAAHKKFLTARLAELCLGGALLIITFQYGTPYLNEQIDLATTGIQQTAWLSLAASLIVITAMIKSAQLPLHGWLMQVVEAPTPVSALLHAGVINLGGFLLLLTTPLWLPVLAAQWLILIVAGLSTVMAALIMTTRISYKVRLAWSTSAQMGLMLIECALGLVELAALHLITHSLYKAYAFLNSGHAVHEHQLRHLAPAITPGFASWIIALFIAAGLSVTAVLLSGYEGPLSIWLLLTLALSMHIAQRSSLYYRASILLASFSALVLVASYTAGKTIFNVLLPDANHVQAGSLADLWVMSLWLMLFWLAWFLRYRPEHPTIQTLSIRLFSGLYLDEWLTRLTQSLWPVRLPTTRGSVSPQSSQRSASL